MAVEQPREVARAGGGEAGQRLQAPGPGRIGAHRVLHPVDRRVEVVAPREPGRELRVVPGAAQVDHEVARHRRRAGRIDEARHQMQHQVDAGGDTRTRQPLAVLDEQPVLQHPRRRGEGGQLRAGRVMGGAGMPVEEPGPGGEQRTGADRDQAVAGPDLGPQPGDDRVVRRPLVLARGIGIPQHPFRRAGEHHGRPLRQRRGQGAEPREPEPDRARDGGARPDMADPEADLLLDQVGLAQHLDGPATSRSRVRGGHTTTTGISAGPLTRPDAAPVRRAPPRPWRCGRSARPGPARCGPGSRRRSTTARRRPSSRR